MDTPTPEPYEVHDPQALAQARTILDACSDARAMQEAVTAAVRRNETWRGQQCINLLARANIIANKNLIPGGTPADWDRPGGLRMGTIEVTRLGRGPEQMATIADFMARVLVARESPETVGEDVIEFRQAYQTLYYNFDYGLPRG